MERQKQIQGIQHDQHQLMSHQGDRTNTNGGDRLFPQRSCVEKSYLSMTQGSGQELLPQQNDSDALMTQDQHHDQHKFMNYQSLNSDTNNGDDSFFSEFSIEELQEL